MTTRKFNLYAALLGLILAFTACQPEEFSMGEILSKDQLNYSITQNPEDPNMILLESLTPGVTPLWQTPMGRSILVKDTVKIPFAGDYKFVYGVESPGGYVQADTFSLTLNTNNLNYVNDPLWEMLSGGVGNSKTWLLDLDENGVSKYFAGPHYFYGTDNGWLAGGDNGCYGTDCWNWNPDWPGNTWLMPQGDYGTMTFDLIGGAHISVDHLMIASRGSEQGTYFLDAAAKTLKLTDAAPLHNEGRDGHVVNWGDLKVMSLTENTMQLAALRDKALSGEDPCLLVYNFISQEYADNWVPEDLPDPEPELPDGWMDDVSQTVNSTLTWKFSENNPLDWAKLDGSLMNGWQLPGDYPDWLGTPDASVYGGFSMTMNSADGTVEFVDPSGTKTTGTYTLDEKGIYSFDFAVPSFPLVGWASFGADFNNQLRIVKIEKDAEGAVKGMWLGALAADKPEYMAYHLELQVGGAADPLAPWKKALVGKTFVPDVNWFVDWVTSPPNFTGGWTSASTFGEDYNTNTWIWTLETRTVAEAASLYFFEENGELKCTKTQGTASETSAVEIDPEAGTLVFGMELINYDGSPASWLPRGGDGVVWNFVPHGGSTLGNIDTNGLWLGFENSKPGENDKPDGETTILHYLVQ